MKRFHSVQSTFDKFKIGTATEINLNELLAETSRQMKNQ